jgi:carbon monoxide dehydrogenase subunit G
VVNGTIVTHDALRSFHTDLERDRVWAFFWEIPSLARCIPGCESVVSVDEGESYTASVRRRVGPFSLSFALAVTVLDRTPPSEISIEVRGEDRRLRSEVRQEIVVRLSDAPDAKGTRGEIRAKVEVTGLLASLGANLVRMHVDQGLTDFVDAIEKALVDRSATIAQ